MVKQKGLAKKIQQYNIIMTLHYVTVSIKVCTWISKAAVSTLDSAIYLALQTYLFIDLSLYLCSSSFSNIC